MNRSSPFIINTIKKLLACDCSKWNVEGEILAATETKRLLIIVACIIDPGKEIARSSPSLLIDDEIQIYRLAVAVMLLIEGGGHTDIDPCLPDCHSSHKKGHKFFLLLRSTPWRNDSQAYVSYPFSTLTGRLCDINGNTIIPKDQSVLQNQMRLLMIFTNK